MLQREAISLLEAHHAIFLIPPFLSCLQLRVEKPGKPEQRPDTFELTVPILELVGGALMSANKLMPVRDLNHSFSH